MPTTLKQQLQTLAQNEGFSLNQLINNRINTSINTAQRDTTTPNPNSHQNNIAGGVGFGPTTTGLGGHHPSFIDYCSVKDDFSVWLRSRGLSEDYWVGMLRHLDRFSKPIHVPLDVARVFDGLSVGQRHGLIRAVRNLLKFYEFQGFAGKDWLDLLRKNIPKDEVGFDVNVPDEAAVVESLRRLGEAKGFWRYFSVYNLVLDSGLRLSEAIRFVDSLKLSDVQCFDGFCVAPLGYFRKCKLAYFAFFTDYTMRLLKNTEKIKYETARGNVRKRLGKDIISYKYLRKFAFDTMTDEQLNIPESVADFIQGRVPKSVGARHYMQLKRKAIRFYPRYAEYITELRKKALN
jgi:intergrase/recombinase